MVEDDEKERGEKYRRRYESREKRVNATRVYDSGGISGMVRKGFSQKLQTAGLAHSQKKDSLQHRLWKTFHRLTLQPFAHEAFRWDRLRIEHVVLQSALALFFFVKFVSKILPYGHSNDQVFKLS